MSGGVPGTGSGSGRAAISSPGLRQRRGVMLGNSAELSDMTIRTKLILPALTASRSTGNRKIEKAVLTSVDSFKEHR